MPSNFSVLPFVTLVGKSTKVKYFLAIAFSKSNVDNPNHEINIDSPKILDRSNHVTKLRIKETLPVHISKTEPQLNVDNQSLPLYRFNA